MASSRRLGLCPRTGQIGALRLDGIAIAVACATKPIAVPERRP
jgi:hypothetical protein